jgi:hypothetical protein
MGKLIEIVKQFFTNDNWNFRELEDNNVLEMAIKGNNARWTCYAQVNEEQENFFFYSVYEEHIPEERRKAMAEFVTRANYGLKVGNFELDFSDGEVRFKTSIDVEKDRLTPALITNLVAANIWSMDRYWPGITAVAFEDVEPKQAIEKIEE